MGYGDNITAIACESFIGDQAAYGENKATAAVGLLQKAVYDPEVFTPVGKTRQSPAHKYLKGTKGLTMQLLRHHAPNNYNKLPPPMLTH